MEYRLYFLDATQHIRSVFAFNCENDEQAIEIAAERAAGKPVELWSRDRVVMRSRVSETTE